MFVCARDIVARTPDFDILAQNMTLRPWQWEMLHSFDDRTSLGAIARRIGVDLASITESLSALEQHGLIKIRTVTREEYRRVFEMAAPGSAPAAPGLDDDDDVPAAKAAPAVKAAPPAAPSSQSKPLPATGEPLSVRLEALRAKAEQAQAQRPPSADTAPFQAQAAPVLEPEMPAHSPAPAAVPIAELDAAALAANSASVEAAQAPPEPPSAAAGFDAQLADLKARLDESLTKPEESGAGDHGGLADFTDSLSGRAVETRAELAAADEAAYEADGEAAAAESSYQPAPEHAGSVNGNGTVGHQTIAFSLAGEPVQKPALSPDAIEFSLGGTSPDTEPPKPPPLKY